MTVDEAQKIAQVLGSILNGNAVGFFIMLGALATLAYVVKRLWSMVERRLADCERQHGDCQKENAALSRALIDLSEGRNHEAKARAETVLHFQG